MYISTSIPLLTKSLPFNPRILPFPPRLLTVGIVGVVWSCTQLYLILLGEAGALHGLGWRGMVREGTEWEGWCLVVRGGVELCGVTRGGAA